MTDITQEDVEIALEVYLDKLERFLLQRGWVVDKDDCWGKGKERCILNADEAFWEEVKK